MACRPFHHTLLICNKACHDRPTTGKTLNNIYQLRSVHGLVISNTLNSRMWLLIPSQTLTVDYENHHWIEAWMTNYNITVRIWVRNDIHFSIRQVFSFIMKASACDHTIYAKHWHRLWEIPKIIVVKSKVPAVNVILRFVVGMFYCCRIVCIALKSQY